MNLPTILSRANKDFAKLGHQEDEGFYLPDLNQGFHFLESFAHELLTAYELDRTTYQDGHKERWGIK